MAKEILPSIIDENGDAEPLLIKTASDYVMMPDGSNLTQALASMENTQANGFTVIENKLDEKIGANTDAASSSGPSSFALLKYVVARFTGFWTDARAAKLDTIDTINSAVGATGNTGGSTTAGSAMAKLNAILTNLANWTATRAGYIDTINTNVNTVNSTKLGATGDTGGSATAGTAMAKLNAILTNLANWTATRAGYIDTINTNVNTINGTKLGATGDTGGSTTAGSAMAKLNAILSNLANWTAARAGMIDNINTKVNSSITANTIKSIQRGVGYFYSTSTAPQSFTINTVTPGKCLVLLDAATNHYVMMGVYLSSLTATTLTVDVIGVQNATLKFSYQVIEFN